MKPKPIERRWPKNIPRFSQPQLKLLKLLLTPDCCHVEAMHFQVFHDPEVLCNDQKIQAFDNLCKFLRITPSAIRRPDCRICEGKMVAGWRETNRLRMIADRRKHRAEHITPAQLAELRRMSVAPQASNGPSRVQNSIARRLHNSLAERGYGKIENGTCQITDEGRAYLARVEKEAR